MPSQMNFIIWSTQIRSDILIPIPSKISWVKAVMSADKPTPSKVARYEPLYLEGAKRMFRLTEDHNNLEFAYVFTGVKSR